jgi:hypothetical protein
MDQFDSTQLDGIGPSPESLWNILLLNAVCRLYGPGRNGSLASRHLFDGSFDCQFNHHPADLFPGGYSAHASRCCPWFTGCFDSYYYEKSHLCRLDVGLPSRFTYLEFRSTSVFILAL